MNHITEATRYIENAKSILSEKAKKEDGYYLDKKYVRMAGNIAYLGVLEALDGVFGTKTKGRKSVEWYKENLGKVDEKITNVFASVYNILHLALGYDGELNAKIATEGLNSAQEIIAWAEMKTN